MVKHINDLLSELADEDDSDSDSDSDWTDEEEEEEMEREILQGAQNGAS